MSAEAEKLTARVHAETDEPVLLDTGSPTVRSRFETLCRQRRLELKGIFNSARIQEIRIATDGSLLMEVVKFFKLRRNRRPSH